MWQADRSYLGLVPLEESSGNRRRLGHITKQGNSLLRFLLVEAAQVTVRSDQEWRNQYFHLALRRGRKIAKVAMAETGGSHVLDVAQGMGIPLPITGEFEVVIMIESVTEETHGSD